MSVKGWLRYRCTVRMRFRAALARQTVAVARCHTHRRIGRAQRSAGIARHRCLAAACDDQAGGSNRSVRAGIN
jgi:hypothetical protein